MTYTYNYKNVLYIVSAASSNEATLLVAILTKESQTFIKENYILVDTIEETGIVAIEMCITN